MINHQWQGKLNKHLGDYFEKCIEAGCDYYLREGVAKIEKQQEPMSPLRSYGRGLWIAKFDEKAGVDYKGVIDGGRCVVFEAKYTDTETMVHTRVKKHQLDYLVEHEAMGSAAFIILGFGGGGGNVRAYRLPLYDWINAKTVFGHVTLTEDDLRAGKNKYEVKVGYKTVYFLEGIEDGVI